jgi:hypothetical protein
VAVTDAEVDERIEQLTAKILKLSKQLFGAAEELGALAKIRRVSAPCSVQLLAAHAAIAGVLRPDEEQPARAGGN